MSSLARQFCPEPDLAPAVDAFWVHAGSADDPGAIGNTVQVFPDGCIDLIFRWRASAAGMLTDSELLVAGVNLHAKAVAVEPGTSFVGVRLRPGMSRILIDADPKALAGHDLRASEVDPSLAPLAVTLQSVAHTPTAVLSVLRDEVRQRSRLNRHRFPPRRVRQVLAMLQGGQQRMGMIAREAGITGRSLHRDIAAWTGLAPKSLARILRFQAALGRIQTDPAATLVQVALEMGFADQAHMSADFQDLAGLSPSLLRPRRPA